MYDQILNFVGPLPDHTDLDEPVPFPLEPGPPLHVIAPAMSLPSPSLHELHFDPPEVVRPHLLERGLHVPFPQVDAPVPHLDASVPALEHKLHDAVSVNVPPSSSSSTASSDTADDEPSSSPPPVSRPHSPTSRMRSLLAHWVPQALLHFDLPASVMLQRLLSEGEDMDEFLDYLFEREHIDITTEEALGIFQEALVDCLQELVSSS